ncbi:MAG: DNA methyltransferase [Atribacterota bacterium]|nr:DNA methyltransferase [Atribacterota bacterium]
MKTEYAFSKVSVNCNQNIDIRRLVTPYQNKKLPVYGWYNFKHSFSRDLVIKLIEKFHLNDEDKILDPFCGSGTTLLASKEIGISVQGIDILPLSVFISNSKLYKYNSPHIKNVIKEIKNLLEKNNTNHTINKSKKELLTKFIREDILNKILYIKEWIEAKDNTETRYFLLSALLSILEEVSYTRKDGGFPRILKEKKIPDLKSAYLSKLNNMAKDIEFIEKLPDTYAEAIEGDARKTIFESNSFSAVITSPPYPNRHDYTRVYSLELITGFLDTQEDIKTLRYHSVRSHVEARRKFIAKDYEPPNTLNIIFKRLEETSLPNREIIKMLEGYFEDMHLVLKEIKRLLIPHGKVAFVIGDVRYGGVMIPVSDVLINIGNNIGLEFKEKITARMRGNSPQQMKKYGREPMEENILIWEKR